MKLVGYSEILSVLWETTGKLPKNISGNEMKFNFCSLILERSQKNEVNILRGARIIIVAANWCTVSKQIKENLLVVLVKFANMAQSMVQIWARIARINIAHACAAVIWYDNCKYM